VASPVAVPAGSYENTCDGAQPYVDDLDKATTAHVERTGTWAGMWEFYLAYYRATNPPPILEEWTDAQIGFWAALTDLAASPFLPSERLEAVNAAEEELKDTCEGYDFIERFGG
jgi:hypothetical protein